MKKNLYISATYEVIHFDCDDVIVTSPASNLPPDYENQGDYLTIPDED
jgi:hypothetical protein